MRDYDLRDQDDHDRTTRDRGNARYSTDPRHVFSRDLDLPGGCERELVRDRDRDYRLSGSDTRTLATVGAFRIVPERDLSDSRNTTFEARERGLCDLEKQGLIQRVSVNEKDRAVALGAPT